ncbi:MAG: hypothetical protein HS113_14810 [Verrucomicrobiales bacterium]|nr:hypothetical protein [Verrucomicrobiales bacterium]
MNSPLKPNFHNTRAPLSLNRWCRLPACRFRTSWPTNLTPRPRSLFTGLALFAATLGLLAQDLSFTVQGRLTETGKPAEGLYDFHFTLLDGPDGDALDDRLQPEVRVQDGLFATTVTFRPAFFDVFVLADDELRDRARFLRVAVRPSEAAASLQQHAGRAVGIASPAAPLPGFVTVQPAIRLTPAPTAIHAAAAASVTPGAVTPSLLVGTALPSTVSGLVSVQAGSRFAVVPAPAPAWLLAGNAATTPTNFLGTTDNRPLDLRVNQQRALRLEPASPSPNLIGGAADNTVTGAAGAVIGGGGNSAEPNLAHANYVFIGGGSSNLASGLAAVVGGGVGNAATNSHAAVGGGWQNLAGGAASTIAGGASNQTAGDFANIGGGQHNTTSGNAATIAGGQDNSSALDQSTVGGGGGNDAAGVGATIGGGIGNRAHLDLATVSGGGENWAREFGATVAGGVGNNAHGTQSSVGGGEANVATGPFAIIPGGQQARASQHGQMAQAAGAFTLQGDAQSSVFVLRAATAPGQPLAVLSLDGQSAPLRIELNRTLTFDILIAGRSAGVPPNFAISGGYHARGVIQNTGGTVAFVGTPTVLELGEDDPAWGITLATGPDHLIIQANSAATPDSVRWVARVQTAEVAW